MRCGFLDVGRWNRCQIGLILWDLLGRAWCCKFVDEIEAEF